MKKSTFLKKALSLTSSLISITVASSAYAACTQVSSTDDYECTGAGNTSQVIFHDDANLTAQSGFSINDSGSDGLFIRGDGLIRYMDTYGSAITAGGGDAIRVEVQGDTGSSGGVIINTAAGAVLQGQDDGIDITNLGSSTVSVTLGGNVTADTGTGVDIVNTNGNFTYLTINSGVTVTGDTAGVSINHGGSGGGAISLYGTIATSGISNDALILGNLAANMDVNLRTGSHIIGNTTASNIANGFSRIMALDDFTTQGNFTASSFGVASGKTLTISKGNNIFTNTMAASTGAVWQFEVQDSSTYGSLDVSNSAINLTGSTVKVLVSGTGLANGDKIRLGTGSAAVVGLGAGLTTVADNSSLWNFEIGSGSDSTFSSAAEELWLLVSAVASGNTFSSLNDSLKSTIGTALDTISASSSVDPTLQNTVNTLSGLSGNTKVTAVDTLKPVSTTVQPMRLPKDIQNNIFSTISSSFESSFKAPVIKVTPGGNPFAGYSVWSQGFGGVVRQDARGVDAAYTSRMGGLVAGIDTQELVKNTITGLSFSYGASSSDTDDLSDAETNTDSYGLAAYARHSFGDRAYVQGIASYSFNTFDTARHNIGGAGGPSAYGSYNGHLVGLRAETGRTLSVAGANVTPSINGSWTHLTTQSYQETGAGGLGLNVDSLSFSELEMGAGLAISRTWTSAEGETMTPALSLGYRYNLTGDSIESTSSFIGAPGVSFTSSGEDPARSTYNIGASFVYDSNSNWDINASYNMDLKDSYVGHSATLRGTFHF